MRVISSFASLSSCARALGGLAARGSGRGRRRREGALRAQLLVGVAAAVEVGLGERVGLLGLVALFELTSTTSITLCGASHLGDGQLEAQPDDREDVEGDGRRRSPPASWRPDRKRSSRKSEKETRASGEAASTASAVLRVSGSSRHETEL
jgi:hypothetical protein